MYRSTTPDLVIRLFKISYSSPLRRLLNLMSRLKVTDIRKTVHDVPDGILRFKKVKSEKQFCYDKWLRSTALNSFQWTINCKCIISTQKKKPSAHWCKTNNINRYFKANSDLEKAYKYLHYEWNELKKVATTVAAILVCRKFSNLFTISDSHC
jgi:hypothetical protein